MKIFGVIPSRYESSRFPGKPLIDLKGKTMIQRVYEQSKKAKMLDDVYVATDDERIAEHVREFGDVIMTGKDLNSGTDRCAEVSQKLENCDIVINIQGDEPLIRPEQIDQLAKLMVHPKVVLGTLITPFNDTEEIDNPNRIKVVFDQCDQALYFSRNKIPFTINNNNENIQFWRHIGMYGYQKEQLIEIAQLPESQLEKAEHLEQLRWLENGYKIHVASTDQETPNIDTPEDVDRVMSFL